MIDISETLIEADTIKITKHRYIKSFMLDRGVNNITRYTRSRVISISCKLRVNYFTLTVYWYCDVPYWTYSLTTGSGQYETQIKDLYKIVEAVEYLKAALEDKQ